MSRSAAPMTACLLFILVFRQITADSLQYVYTAVTAGTPFPQFTAVGLLDGEQFVYYDSNIRTMISKTEWSKKVDADYWKSETELMRDDQSDLEDLLFRVRKHFNHPEGVHTMQRSYGCELYNNGTIRGFDQFGYDGADFISLDLKTETWTAANNKALITKEEFERNGFTNGRKIYLEKVCTDWLKKIVTSSRETLERKDPPQASLFQKLSSPPELVCHATGFFPKDVMMSWQKNGENLTENMKLLETLPNNDGSFQKRIILRVSPEELQKHDYTCVIQHSSMKEDLVLKASEGSTPADTGADSRSKELLNTIMFAVILSGLLFFVFYAVVDSICKSGRLTHILKERIRRPLTDLERGDERDEEVRRSEEDRSS